MLPSFRLIAATFLCGFAVVFAGLRLAASLNDIHEGLPVMAAHAAPLGIADGPGRRLHTANASAVRYDLHFALPAAQPASPPAPINVTALVIDRAAPLTVTPLLSIALPSLPAKPVSAPAPAAAEPADPADAVEAVASIPLDRPIAAPMAASAPPDAPPPEAPAPVAAEPQPAPPAVAAETAAPQ
jgi:hypothetical protein